MIRPLVVILFALTSSAALFATASGASPRYRVTQLHAVSIAAGMYATANSINDRGEVVGGELALTTASDPRIDWTKARPLAWDASSAVSTLPNVAGYGGVATAVNNLGLTVGVSASTTLAFPAPRATIFRSAGATLIPFGTPSNASRAADVTDANLVVGTDSALPYAFDATLGTQQPVNRNNANWNVTAANESGYILANNTPFGSFNTRPARLDDTAAPQFLIPSGHRGEGFDVNNAGVAVGRYSSVATGSASAAIFANGTVATFSLDAITGGVAMAINDRGDIVGTAGADTAAARDRSAFLRRDGATIALSTLIDGYTLPAGFIPVDINDRGQIIGNVFTDHDGNAATPPQGIAFRLDPIRTAGDTNYDGRVNFDDLLALAQSYGDTGNGTVFWETGDFNFDWSVDFADLLTLAQHYENTSSFAADWALAQAMVPEPVSVAMLALSPLMCVRSRRR